MFAQLGVAPHVGAWIETEYEIDSNTTFEVAPHVGAWIETFFSPAKIPPNLVAPHVGAWIETTNDYDNNAKAKSLLMWERGLKPIVATNAESGDWSLLMWERGLKHLALILFNSIN